MNEPFMHTYIIVLMFGRGPLGAVKRVRRHGGDDAEALLQGRAQILKCVLTYCDSFLSCLIENDKADRLHKSVWRPIHGTVQDWPLALMDYRSIKDSEIHPTSIFKERFEMQGQTVSINHSDDQQWFYLDQQEPTEVTFIKIWDNKEDVAKSKSRKPILHQTKWISVVYDKS